MNGRDSPAGCLAAMGDSAVVDAPALDEVSAEGADTDCESPPKEAAFVSLRSSRAGNPELGVPLMMSTSWARTTLAEAEQSF